MRNEEFKKDVQIREAQKIVELAADLRVEGYAFKQSLLILKETFPNMKTTTQDLKTLRRSIREELS